jgi:DNA-binding NtrC family response regulator
MAKKGSILVVDDEEIMRDVLETLLSAEGYRVDLARTGEEGLECYGRKPYDVVLLDVSMPGMGGLRALEEILKADAEAVVLMVTASATFDTAIAAWERGAAGCIRKPFQNELILERVAEGIKRRRKEEERQTLRRALSRNADRGGIVGRSERMQAVFRLVDQVAPARSTVLITGESGTGKELVARAIHNLSPRAEKPFVSINCGAFTETLLESELFGYVKGSFTGASANRKGLFEAADHGSIFLDEIGEMSPAMQVKLLRVLQERKVRPVGAHEETSIDARVICATNRDLKSMVGAGTFREDLFYRVSVIPIELPPLRERGEDIPDLVDHFVRKFCAETGRSLGVSPAAMELLERYNFPGNVRELEHTIERAVALERTDAVQPERLPEQITHYNPARVAEAFDLPDEGLNLPAHLDQLEKTYLLEALRRTAGNPTRAAELLKLSVRSLRHLLDKHGIRSITAQLRSDSVRGGND